MRPVLLAVLEYGARGLDNTHFFFQQPFLPPSGVFAQATPQPGIPADAPHPSQALPSSASARVDGGVSMALETHRYRKQTRCFQNHSLWRFLSNPLLESFSELKKDLLLWKVWFWFQGPKSSPLPALGPPGGVALHPVLGARCHSAPPPGLMGADSERRWARLGDGPRGPRTAGALHGCCGWDADSTSIRSSLPPETKRPE